MELRPAYLFRVYFLAALPEISYTTVLRNALARTFRKFISLLATAYAHAGRKAEAARAPATFYLQCPPRHQRNFFSH
jgi:hypothetical protein